MSAESVWYLDSSAIVKLVARESETPRLLRFLARRQPLVSRTLVMTEVNRAVLPLGDRFLRQADEVLNRIELVRKSSSNGDGRWLRAPD
jgi:predicted nucleic acid-binding protein